MLSFLATRTSVLENLFYVKPKRHLIRGNLEV